ncbi:MAG: hypothetical protein GY931_13630 [Maribacter sp.]|nr:hypothetical protein [Maribacter sp.]
MDAQDNKFNYKIILVALVAVIIGILIAFYYSYAQSNTQISFLEQEKELLVKDLTLMKADVDRLSALNEVNEIEIQGARYEVQQLLDSVGRLTFTIEKLREFKSELRRLESKNDSLKLKNNFLRYNNMLLTEKNAESQTQIEELRKASSSIAEAEALQRQQILELNKELKTKNYLKVEDSEGSGYRLRGEKPIRTNKASVVEKLRGAITIMEDLTMINKDKVLYFQFLGPDMGVIEDNANTIIVQGNVYSKRIPVLFMGEEQIVLAAITVPAGSLKPGKYTFNVFEDQRLLDSTEFQLK